MLITILYEIWKSRNMKWFNSRSNKGAYKLVTNSWSLSDSSLKNKMYKQAPWPSYFV